MNNDKTQFMKKIGVNAYILYSKSKSKMGVSARDFLSNYIINIEPDGTLIAVACSYYVDFDYPVQKSVIRGDLEIGGTMLVPNKDDPNKSYMYVM